MTNTFRNSTLNALFLAASLHLAVAGIANAQTAEVVIDTKLEPTSAAGFVMTTAGTSRVDATFSKLENGMLAVSFPFSAPGEGEEVPEITAVVTAANGEMAFGQVRPLTAPDPKKLLIELPECELEEPPASPSVEQLGLLLKLVEVRSARRELAQIKVNRLMEGPFLEKLRKLEDGFGLAAGEVPLDVNLSSVELVTRLSKIAIAIKNYELHKEKETANP
jgi:hypothetical protein